MFKQFIDKVAGADVYLSASLVIFFLFFLCMLVWLVFADKKYIQKMKHLPVEDDTCH
jgi:cbb3-type cytochrome oxidase subunit 3